MEAFLQRLSSRLGRDMPAFVERPQWKHAPQQTVFQGYSQDELLDELKSNVPAFIRRSLKRQQMGSITRSNKSLTPMAAD